MMCFPCMESRHARCNAEMCKCRHMTDGMKIPDEIRRAARDTGNAIAGGATTPESRFNEEYAVVGMWVRESLMKIHAQHCDYCKVGSLCYELEAMNDFGKVTV